MTLASVTATWPADRTLIVPQAAHSQTVVVDLPADVSVPPEVACQLVEANQAGVVLPVQLITAAGPDGQPCDAKRQLVASVPAGQAGGGERQFRLELGGSTPTAGGGFRLQDDGAKTLLMLEEDRPVLAYNYGMITQESVRETDSRRTASSFIHPLWGLNGEVLTAAFPPDHVHHRGIFWTWKDVEVNGQHYDHWTDTKMQTRFVRWLCRQTGPLAAVVAVENGWFVDQTQVMTERVWMRVFRSDGQTQSIDVQLTLMACDQAVRLGGDGAKSYGGFTLRFDVWPRTDGIVSAPSGTYEDRERRGLEASGDLVNVSLPWADLTSTFAGVDHASGAAVFIHPGHPDYPPTWLTRSYGALCVGWPGTQSKALQASEPATLSYRVWVHKNVVDSQRLDEQYRAYTASTQAAWR